MPETERVQRARLLRKQSTWAENLMWRWLRGRRFSGYKFRRNHPVGRYFLDFFCMEAKLSIELDGGGHGYPLQQVYDEMRSKYLKESGIRELRFWNSELRQHKEAIQETILRELQARANPPHPDPLPQGRGKSCWTWRAWRETLVLRRAGVAF